MPTDLPPRRVPPRTLRTGFARPGATRPALRPKASREGNLAFAVAIVVMLAVSVVLLWLHPADAASLLR